MRSFTSLHGPEQRLRPAGGGLDQAASADELGGDPNDARNVEGICGDAADYWPAKLPGTLLNCAAVQKRVTLVHPNAEGHANTALHVERAIRIALLEH
ncbi:hypothetical protein AB0N77_13020 [Streptomyces misionensis]|uniref:hypothetical protein n=1 Tax=Streptomyces misionensis TaxID=67331 RepID=UPI003440C4AD